MIWVLLVPTAWSLLVSSAVDVDWRVKTLQLQRKPTPAPKTTHAKTVPTIAPLDSVTDFDAGDDAGAGTGCEGALFDAA